MDILIVDSWLREYLQTDATPREIKDYLSLCGPSVERLQKVGGDWLYHIEVTTNRVDSASVMGIAREAAAILPRFGKKAIFTPRLPRLPKSPKFHLPLTIRVEDKTLCSRIMAVIINGVLVEKSPEIIRKRLEMVGIRSLNTIVDITNYVMVETGHPTHVFDYDRIGTNTLVIRKAKKGEKLITLDKKSFTLKGGESIIDDGTGRIIDLPGIMGCANSVVTKDTKRVLFFLETNDPVQMRTASMMHGIRTQAVTLNEKGIDPQLTQTALAMGISFFEKWTSGVVASKIHDWYPNPAKVKKVSVAKTKAFSYLGTTLPDAEIKTILHSLGFETQITKTVIEVIVPNHRSADIAIPEDVIEELARIYGYHRLPAQLPTGQLPEFQLPKILTLEGTIKQLLKGWDYTETYTYSFVCARDAQLSSYPLQDHVALLNPLSADATHMRRSLIPSLARTMAENQSRADHIRLFELANVYIPVNKKLPHEEPSLCIAQQDSYQDLKGIVEGLLVQLGFPEVVFQPSKHPLFTDNQTAVIKINNKIIGYCGTIAPSLHLEYGIKRAVVAAHISVEDLLELPTQPKRFTPIPKHPNIIEDFSLVFPPQTLIGPVITEIETMSPIIKEVLLVGVFEDTQTFRVTFQHPTKNLTKDDIATLRHKILSSVEKKFNGKLRE